MMNNIEILPGWYKSVMNALPENIQRIIKALPRQILMELEEIRIREQRPIAICSGGKDYFIKKEGKTSTNPHNAYYVNEEDTRRILQLISNYSIYAFEEEIRNGYITLKGGCRVGLAGKVVLKNGMITTLTNIKSFNIRIAKEIQGAGTKALPYIVNKENVCQTLIISPPQMGKTTLLRDIARQLSNGFNGFSGSKVCIIDERSEIAGCYQGIPQNQVGLQTDVLDGCPKANGIMMMIRAMSPRIIITDEIGRSEDVYAVEEALGAGVKIITSAHANNLDDILKRPVLSSMLEKKLFDRILILGNSLGVGTLERVYDGQTMKLISTHPIR